MIYKTMDNQYVKIIDIDYKNKNVLVEVVSGWINYLIFEGYYFSNDILYYEDSELLTCNKDRAHDYFKAYYKYKENELLADKFEEE